MAELERDEGTNVVSMRDYIDARIAAVCITVDLHHEGEKYLILRGDETTRELVAAAHASFMNELAALQRLLDEKDKAVQIAWTNAAASQEKFETVMESRLAILNEHKALTLSERASFVTKDTFNEIRDRLVDVDARSSDYQRTVTELRAATLDPSAIRLRLDALEERPVAMNHEERGDIRAQLAEQETKIATLRQDHHDLRGKVQTILLSPPILGKDEIDELRRIIRMVTRADINEFLNGEELRHLKRIIEGKGLRTRRREALETALTSAAIAGVFTIVLYVLTHLVFR